MGKTLEEINEETEYIASFDMKPQDTEVFMKYLRPLPKGSIVVEFGTGQAKNTIRMGLCNPDVDIYTWDWGRGQPGERTYHYFKKISKRLRKHKVDNVYFTVNDSYDAWYDWNEPIDILYIDGAHDYDVTLKDLERWEVYVKKGGYIFIHDYEYGGPDTYKFGGMRKAVQEYFGKCEDEFKYIEYTGGMGVFKKL